MLRGIWGDPERYRDTYWCRFDGKYFAGDGAKRDDEGYFWLLGRVDDIMLVVGPQHLARPRSSRALVDHPAVAEAAVVGKTDDTTGQAIAAFVILRGGNEPSDALVEELRDHVAKLIGPIAKPKSILFTEELPKTRSGKIMRRLLRNVAEDQALGDTTTLADPGVVDGIKSRYLVDRARRRTERRSACATSPSTGPGATSRSSPGRAVVVDIDGVLSDAAEPPALHRGAAPRLARVLRRVRRRPGHRGGAGAARPPRPDARGSCCSPPGRTGCTTSPRRGCAATRSAGTCSSCGRGATTSCPATSSSRRSGSCATYGFDLRLGFEDDRRNVEMFRSEGIPTLYLHSARRSSRACSQRCARPAPGTRSSSTGSCASCAARSARPRRC